VESVPVPPPAVGARDVLLQLVVRLSQPVLTHPVGGHGLEPGRDGQLGQAGDRRITGDGGGVLSPMDPEAHAHKASEQLCIAFVAFGVEVSSQVPSYPTVGGLGDSDVHGVEPTDRDEPPAEARGP
jgi:hypothetical protein